jgi:hypothetical protein
MTFLKSALARLALIAISVELVGISNPAFAGAVVPAPGPIAGAGLPILAIGYGAYWLVKRYRRKTH